MSKTRTPHNPSGVEYRSVGAFSVEDGGKITGLAAPFNSPAQIGDPEWGFREQFAPGSFTKTLNESDVVLLVNHDTSMPIARKSAGSLDLRQTDRGLEYEAVPADTSYSRDLVTNIKAKNITGCSFGFRAVKDDWFDDDGNPSDERNGTQRTVREAQLFEVTAATFPAYGDTDISARDAVAAAREARAAKANYSDLDTCAECDSAGQYGSYCTNCGEPMSEPKPSKNYCSSCGSDLSAERGEHICKESSAVNDTETRDDPKPEGSTSVLAPIVTEYYVLDFQRRSKEVH